MEKRIPIRIQRLFWDLRADQLDIETNAKTIIERVINLGTLADWRWLAATYGRTRLRSALESRDKFGRTSLRPASSRVASLIFA